MSVEDIKRAVEHRNFLPLLVQMHGGRNDVTAAEMRDAAEAAGCLPVYERDEALLPHAIATREAINRYTLKGGKHLRMDDEGVIWIKRNAKTDREYEQRVSSPVLIGSEGYNAADRGPVLQILIHTTTGAWIELFIKRSDLIGGHQLQARLQGYGLRAGAFAELLHLLQNVEPSRKFINIEHAGWNGDYYALPSGEVIPDDENASATFSPVPNFNVGGTSDAAHALFRMLEEQFLFVFAAAAALAAAILAHYGPEAEPGGFHCYGQSSRGKTTWLSCIASIWGVGAEKKDGGIAESWNLTAFAADHIAAKHSDNCMFLDEVRAADPAVFAKLNLQLANGAGKAAGAQHGGLRDSKTFRPTVFSTGEISAKEYIISNGETYNAGMAVRLVDLPADTGSGHGIFNSVPERFNGDAGEFARWIKREAATHYGHLGREFVANYLANKEAFLMEVRLRANSLRADLAAHGAAGDPQTGRVADRFSFVGAVGMVACERGLLPWAAESVRRAALAQYNAWFAARGGLGSQEGIAAERAFSAYAYANYDKFHKAGFGVDKKRIGLMRVEKETNKQEIWVTDEGLAEMVGQPERVKPFLEYLKAGLSDDWDLVPGKDRDKRDSPSGYQLPSRSYCIRAKRQELVAANDDQEQNVDAGGPAL